MVLLQAQDGMPSVSQTDDDLTDYTVTVHTADTQDAGTNADIMLVMFGSTGEPAVLTA